MNTKGKNEAQSVKEMLEEMTDKKERGLSVHRGQSLYKQQSGEYQEEKLKDLISLSLDELAEVATKEQISLNNTAEVKKRTVIYLRACQEAGTFPSIIGLARSMGYSRRALNYWREKYPQSDTGRWLDIVADMCADILSQSALKNNANSIVSIFLSKALYEMRETSELIVKPGSDISPENEYSAEEIANRYMLPANDTEEV